MGLNVSFRIRCSILLAGALLIIAGCRQDYVVGSDPSVQDTFQRVSSPRPSFLHESPPTELLTVTVTDSDGRAHIAHISNRSNGAPGFCVSEPLGSVLDVACVGLGSSSVAIVTLRSDPSLSVFYDARVSTVVCDEGSRTELPTTTSVEVVGVRVLWSGSCDPARGSIAFLDAAGQVLDTPEYVPR